jgi:glyoxylase-like metal-dependent hydrolase (beta-lactamase superfamily II)
MARHDEFGPLERRRKLTQILGIPLGFDTCYVVRESGTVVIDAGQPRCGGRFAKGLAEAAIAPEEVRLILLTHAHWDHMGSAAELREMTGAPLAVHEKEASWVEEGDPPLPPGVTAWGRVFMAGHRLLMPLIDIPPAPVDLRLDDSVSSLDDYGVEGVAIPTPGHSPGSVSVVLKGGEAFVGDLAMNKLPLTRGPSLPIFADDLQMVIQSWGRLLDMGVSTVFPAHGKPFSVDVVRRWLAKRPDADER